mmetsp:Transcript_731/g.1055  ORF Transcript_731/g.1055 Transcript_731/m.1055 type:complete len:282 (-) Transcript_731:533-1378(-)
MCNSPESLGLTGTEHSVEMRGWFLTAASSCMAPAYLDRSPPLTVSSVKEVFIASAAMRTATSSWRKNLLPSDPWLATECMVSVEIWFSMSPPTGIWMPPPTATTSKVRLVLRDSITASATTMSHPTKDNCVMVVFTASIFAKAVAALAPTTPDMVTDFREGQLREIRSQSMTAFSSIPALDLRRFSMSEKVSSVGKRSSSQSGAPRRAHSSVAASSGACAGNTMRHFHDWCRTAVRWEAEEAEALRSCVDSSGSGSSTPSSAAISTSLLAATAACSSATVL